MSEQSKAVLSALRESGARTPESALPLEALAAKTSLTEEAVATEVNVLVVDGHANLVVRDGMACVYLTRAGNALATGTPAKDTTSTQP